MLAGLPFPLVVVLVLLAVGFFVWLLSQATFVAEPYKKIAIAIVLFFTLVWLIVSLYSVFWAGAPVAPRHASGNGWRCSCSRAA